jgi:hypothetical protein
VAAGGLTFLVDRDLALRSGRITVDFTAQGPWAGFCITPERQPDAPRSSAW